MAKGDEKGSIVLKIVILFLSLVLLAVILIPGKIWDQEALEKKITQANMMSIYESEKFFKRMKGYYTSDPGELIRTIRQDTSILKQQKVVNYTKKLTTELDSYQRIAYIKGILQIDQNIRNIITDLESNRRYLKSIEDIKNESEDIRLKLTEINNSAQFSKYNIAAANLDSLVQLRRDLSDFSLQTCASRSFMLTTKIQTMLSDLNIQGVKAAWLPLSQRLEEFVKQVNRSELTQQTSVADRVKDFTRDVNRALAAIEATNISKDINAAKSINANIEQLYQQFLTDFIITGKRALYRLSDSDSMVLHITEANFYSPVTHEMYKIIIDTGNTAVKIESPILLNEFKAKAQLVTKDIKSLPILPAYKEYIEKVAFLKDKGMRVRKELKKNTDIFIKYKELEEFLKNFDNLKVIEAYNNFNAFVETANNTESYSDLNLKVENSLNASRIFNQAYSENVFGNLDTLHAELIGYLNEFNQLMRSERRLPEGITNFDQDISQINDLSSRIKNIASPGLIDHLVEIESSLSELFLFAEEGLDVSTYVFFKKRLETEGYIFKDIKSWEEKK